MKPHFRAIVLIMAANLNYRMYRKVWKHYMFKDANIKVMFAYGKSNKNLIDYNKDYDIISNIPESIGIAKILDAFKIIEERFTYDYLIRTNLSTFWDFAKLHKHFDTLPTENCYSGDGPLPFYNKHGYYLSGTDTIVTPEMIASINRNNDKVNKHVIDDMAMGLYFNGILGVPMLPTNKICFFEDIQNVHQIDEIRNRIDDAIKNDKTHYRVKNKGDREKLDGCVYRELLNKIYGISIKLNTPYLL